MPSIPVPDTLLVYCGTPGLSTYHSFWYIHKFKEEGEREVAMVTIVAMVTAFSLSKDTPRPKMTWTMNQVRPIGKSHVRGLLCMSMCLLLPTPLPDSRWRVHHHDNQHQANPGPSLPCNDTGRQKVL